MISISCRNSETFTIILRKREITETIQRMAGEIVKKNESMDDVVLVGIRTGGAFILVDDVLFTGRTVRAAMDAPIDFGRPKKIELAILADRGDGDRELPIKADYVGGVWPTSSHETINVYLKEAGFDDHVTIEEKRAA